MKKLLSILLAVCCCLGILGCSQKDKAPENSATVYLKREKPVFGAADGVIAPVYMDISGQSQDPAQLLGKYLRGVPGEGFVSPFPKGLFLISFKLEGLTAKVILSDGIAELTGMDLTVALTCLTQTVMSLTGCREVIISAATALLDGEKFITLSQDSFLLVDDSGVNS